MSDLSFRHACREDLPRLVELLADDALGSTREVSGATIAPTYDEAFNAIDADPHQELVVLELDGSGVVGMLQITYTPYLTYQGGWRATVEGVRIARSERGQGLGRALMEDAMERARRRGCHMLQLTTDRQRPDAVRFYEGLGFANSHDGFKHRFAASKG